MPLAIGVNSPVIDMMTTRMIERNVTLDGAIP